MVLPMKRSDCRDALNPALCLRGLEVLPGAAENPAGRAVAPAAGASSFHGAKAMREGSGRHARTEPTCALRAAEGAMLALGKVTGHLAPAIGGGSLARCCHAQAPTRKTRARKTGNRKVGNRKAGHRQERAAPADQEDAAAALVDEGRPARAGA
jgi:hypothetical protein